jgi:hypothetical protein
VKQGTVAKTAFVKLAVPSLFNYVLCKVFPHEFGLLIRKFSPTGFDGLPSAIECGKQDTNGVRIKYARIYMIVEEVAHAHLRVGEAMLSLFLRFGECFAVAAARDRSATLIDVRLSPHKRRKNGTFPNRRFVP